MTRASLEKKPHEVAAMFDRTARRYDLVNDLMTMGQTYWWRKVVADAVDAGPGELVLDIGGGTGTSAVSFTRLGARAIACDFSLGMLREGTRRLGGSGVSGGGVHGVTFTAGDALRLPFADDSFDVVTISYALRNVADTEQALREMLRVAKPGGRLVVAEFSRPTFAPFRFAYYNIFLKYAIPLITRLTSSNPDSYDYLSESIQAWPDQPSLARVIQRAGWSRVAWRNLSLGAVAVHRARKPERDSATLR
ncbi:demethylmenaquinone methyltransferase [Bailinhaonella thermotolerans]|uniref:Demethylmenaquinone methyltransferase n=1 Tax=Bailinhaonella thermotolerans TaxID=1070861 RepID=A0A3A4ASQ6_9ACTN|nr:demethylmenaquinone methyltransferase [Bailinhaonella thermotolerans]RJL22507.1 demethylmenaquinone methyltransferase [Bailinhaonella thermotolerans]